MGHVVGVLSFQLVTHGFDFGAVGLNLTLVIFQLEMRINQHFAQVFNVLTNAVGVRGRRATASLFNLGVI